MRNTFALAALTFAVLGGSALAQSLTFPTKGFKVNSPSTDDLARVKNEDGVKRLRKTDEEFTNEQSDVRLFADGTRGLYVEMRSSSLAGTLPENKMQGACTPIELVQGTTGSIDVAKRPGEKWVTNNDGNERRNANHPFLVPVGLNEMLYTYNYQAAGTSDTKRYAKILDPDCNPVRIRDAAGQLRDQIVIMAKQNDDCSMNEDGGGVDTRALPNGTVRVVMWAGCNGNGKDDGWLNAVDVSCAADAVGMTCQIVKQFDVSLAKREERSRGRCSMSSADPDTAICTWTEGNNQPQRDGTWIAAVDVSGTGRQDDDGKARVLWKKLIEGRKPLAANQIQPEDPNPNEDEKKRAESRSTYSVRAKSARVLSLDGTGSLVKSDLLFVSTGNLVGSNRNDRKGGRYVDARLGVARANRTGLEWLVPMTSINDQLVGFDYTHIKMTGVMIQNDGRLLPGVTFLQGSQNGGGVHPPDVKVLAFSPSEARFIDYGSHPAVGTSYDRHLYSNYLGNNPGNQGRNFAGATFVKNPFEGVNGSRSKFLVLHALTGKDPADVGRPELKPSSYLSTMELIIDGLPPASVPGLNGSGGGQNATDATLPNGCGCTGGASSMSGLLLLVGALVGVDRRRSRRAGSRS